MRRSNQSRPRYKSRLNKDRVSPLASMLLLCSSSLSDSESLFLESRSSLTLLLVLFACSLLSLSFACNKVSLHFRVVRPDMWQEQHTAQDTRPKTHRLEKILQKAVVRQLVLFISSHQVWKTLMTKHLKPILIGWLKTNKIYFFIYLCYNVPVLNNTIIVNIIASW